jgi:hypothetical protein
MQPCVVESIQFQTYRLVLWVSGAAAHSIGLGRTCLDKKCRLHWKQEHSSREVLSFSSSNISPADLV